MLFFLQNPNCIHHTDYKLNTRNTHTHTHTECTHIHTHAHLEHCWFVWIHLANLNQIISHARKLQFHWDMRPSIGLWWYFLKSGLQKWKWPMWNCCTSEPIEYAGALWDTDWLVFRSARMENHPLQGPHGGTVFIYRQNHNDRNKWIKPWPQVVWAHIVLVNQGYNCLLFLVCHRSNVTGSKVYGKLKHNRHHNVVIKVHNEMQPHMLCNRIV